MIADVTEKIAKDFGMIPSLQQLKNWGDDTVKNIYLKNVHFNKKNDQFISDL